MKLKQNEKKKRKEKKKVFKGFQIWTLMSVTSPVLKKKSKMKKHKNE
jgi:hypothetical protein